jgi:hypothetical protein
MNRKRRPRIFPIGWGNRNSLIVWKGASLIDGAPIMLILSALERTLNRKTGPMVQSYILRADISPTDAIATGKDISICGSCRHRGHGGHGANEHRTCYVFVEQGPESLWNTAAAGSIYSTDPKAAGAYIAGRKLRLGAYGDPAAVPVWVWEALLEHASGWTGYTHQYRAPKLQGILKYVQVSADTVLDATLAHQAGLGSFRVLAKGEVPLPFEKWCPADGETVTCASCLECHGLGGGNIVIEVHGSKASKYRSPTNRGGFRLPVL